MTKPDSMRTSEAAISLSIIRVRAELAIPIFEGEVRHRPRGATLKETKVTKIKMKLQKPQIRNPGLEGWSSPS